MYTMFVTLVVLLASTASEPASPGPGYVSLCDLVQNPEKYDQRTVLTAGVINPGGNIGDKACGAGVHGLVSDTSIFLQFVRGDDGSEANTRLSQLIKSGHWVFIVIEARFDAYRRYTGPLPPDKHLQEVLKEGNARFGPLRDRFRLAVQNVLLAEPTEENLSGSPRAR